MTGLLRRLTLGAVALASVSLYGQSATAPAKGSSDQRASAYYHATLGHIYAELAAQYGPRGDYLTKAIDNYKLAMREDPGTAYLPQELADLYIESGQARTAINEFEATLKENPNDLNVRRILARFYASRINQGPQQRINEEMLKAAITQYTEISKRDPNDVDNWIMLGRLQRSASHSPEAEQALQTALKLDPDNEEAMTILALVYGELGASDKANTLLRKVADKNPNMRTLTALAATYEQMKDYKGAAESYRRALDLNRDNTDLKRAYAQSLFMAGDYDASLRAFQEILAEEPSDVGSVLRISQIYGQMHNFDKAHEYAAKASELDPSNFEARINEANLLEAEGKVTAAVKYLKDLAGEMPKKPSSLNDRNQRLYLLNRLGLMYKNTDQTEQAVACFREMMELEPETGARSEAQIVDTYRNAKDLVSAEREVKSALVRYANDRLLKIMLANVQSDQGHEAEAETTLKSLMDGKGDREIWITLAQVHEKAKDWTGMAKAIDEAEKLNDSGDDKELTTFLRGAMYERMKRFDDAEREFRKVLNANPNNASTLNYLGYMLADRNVRLNEALDLISKAVKLDQNNSAFLDSLGWAYYRLNRLDEAEETLRKALQYGTRDATVFDHLGDVLSSRNKMRDAVKLWERSLKEWQLTAPGDMDSDEMAKVQKKLERARVKLAQEHGAKND